MNLKETNIDLLAEMLLRSRELAVDESFDQILPALDAALFITGRAMADRLEDGHWLLSECAPPLN